ncbi:hypothetical protein ACFQXB_11645 [Plastorhodobacter daqingensis]|uniref:Uncharacterized protein n=1 Tax=Plastorhodobacter daqingensis TaxID=1387281 RepID=A0ABW2UMY0_9RHOB
MSIQLTEKQKAAMLALVDGPTFIPSVHAGNLQKVGLVKPATPPAHRRRGYGYVELTVRGREVIS